MKNIERKYQLASEARYQEAAAAVTSAAGQPSALDQTDVYYACEPGARLKLRLERHGGAGPRSAALIPYARPDATDARASRWALFRLGEQADVDAATAVLGTTLREEVRVTKHRQLWMWRGVRVHLDAVERLGWFLEFEDVLTADADEAAAQSRLAELAQELQLERGAVPQSLGYREMALAAFPTGGLHPPEPPAAKTTQ